MIELNTVEPKNLKKSKIVYKIYGGLFLFALFNTVVLKSLLKNYQDLYDLLVGFPILTLFFMAPIGLYYSWKSYRLKEGLSQTRFKYFLGHLFFCFLILLFVVVMIQDFSQLIW